MARRPLRLLLPSSTLLANGGCRSSGSSRRDGDLSDETSCVDVNLQSAAWRRALPRVLAALARVLLHDVANRRESVAALVTQAAAAVATFDALARDGDGGSGGRGGRDGQGAMAIAVRRRERWRIVEELLTSEAVGTLGGGGSSIGGARMGQAGWEVARQLLSHICETRPDMVAPLFANDSALVRQFFTDSSRRVSMWFDQFRGVGLAVDNTGAKRHATPMRIPPGAAAAADNGGRTHSSRTADADADGGSGGATVAEAAGLEGHLYGARALARYAFRHRGTCWHHLVWAGRHAQSPVSVVTRPHYLCELDVAATVRRFLSHVPEFWSSNELRDEMQDGAFLALDPPFFVQQLVEHLQYELQDEYPREGVGKKEGGLPREGAWQAVYDEREEGNERQVQGRCAVKGKGSIMCILRAFVEECELAEVMRRILPLASELSLFAFFASLARAHDRHERQQRRHKHPHAGTEHEQWQHVPGARLGVEVLLLWRRDGDRWAWESMDDLLLSWAVVANGRHVLQLLQHDEEWEEEWKQLQAEVRVLEENLALAQQDKAAVPALQLRGSPKTVQHDAQCNRDRGHGGGGVQAGAGMGGTVVHSGHDGPLSVSVACFMVRMIVHLHRNDSATQLEALLSANGIAWRRQTPTADKRGEQEAHKKLKLSMVDDDEDEREGGMRPKRRPRKKKKRQEIRKRRKINVSDSTSKSSSSSESGHHHLSRRYHKRSGSQGKGGSCSDGDSSEDVDGCRGSGAMSSATQDKVQQRRWLLSVDGYKSAWEPDDLSELFAGMFFLQQLHGVECDEATTAVIERRKGKGNVELTLK